MDESWRVRIGMEIPSTTTTTRASLPRRRSTEDVSHRQRTVLDDSESSGLDPEDFSDVFGGPPRTVIRRQFSRNEYHKCLLYEEIFMPPENVIPARCGRNLPEFRIPVEKSGRIYDDGFYSDIFGWEEEEEEIRRSRTRSGSKSKASSSSVLSSEDVTPLRPAIGEADPDVSFFASKLRPINVPSRWSTRRVPEECPRHQGMPAFSCHPPSYNTESRHNESLRNTHFGFNRRNSSPETISVDPNSYRSLKISTDHDLDLNSPSSVASSIGQDREPSPACRIQDDLLSDHQVVSEPDDDDDDDVMSSYVIEINGSSCREANNEAAIGVDEAIAWAKEKFQKHCSENNLQFSQDEKENSDMPSTLQSSDEQIDGNEFTQATMAEKVDKRADGKGRPIFETDMEMELLDEKIRLWSMGKEADIRLLLSTLHHILWPNNGWLPVPLNYLIESSKVRKAYQKARLCLHPDKLQQRGATVVQKHIAEKAFSILQEAWAVFLSQDIRLS